MKKLTILFVALTLIAAGCSKTNSRENGNEDMRTSKISMGTESENIYDINLMDLEGNEYKLSDQKGKNVYVKFWASWCPVCLSGLNDLNKMAGEENNFEVITVVSPGYGGEKNKEDFLKWFNSLDYENIRVLLDEEGKVFENYGIRSMPTNAIIDSNGKLVKVIPGEVRKEAIKKIFEELPSEG